MSIIGVANGAQPIYDESGNLALVFNGEIYNYHALRSELVERGHAFHTETDAEVVVHLYEELGAACLSHLRGMFAFAIWDKRRKELFIARDRLGIKPLYFTRATGRFLFASEIKALLVAPGVRRGIHLTALERLLAFRHIGGAETLFEGIYKLMPGYWARIRSATGFEVNAYWTPSEVGRPAGDIKAEARRLLSLLDDSVKEHLMSEVPLGATLSGGLDSSLVVALASRHVSSPLRTFSIGFGERDDERGFARVVAEKFRTEHEEWQETYERFLDVLPRILWHMEEPATGSLLPTYFLAERISRKVKVLLVGEGADEIFGGYVRFKPLSPWLSVLPKAISVYGYQRGYNWFSARERRRLLALGSNGGPESALREICEGPARELLNNALLFEQRNELPNHQLLRIDKLTMAFSVEARVPFLDHRIVERANAMPASWKMRGFNEKHVLKEAGRLVLPPMICDRRKQGLSSPISSWCGRGFRDFAMEQLSRARVESRGYFRHEAIEALWKQARGRSWLSVSEFKLNQLMMVELWHQVFIDPERFGTRLSPLSRRA